MIVCPACDHRNPADRDYCEQCGGSLEHFVYRACPACDALNPAQNTFCQRCLTELSADISDLALLQGQKYQPDTVSSITWPPESLAPSPNAILAQEPHEAIDAAELLGVDADDEPEHIQPNEIKGDVSMDARLEDVLAAMPDAQPPEPISEPLGELGQSFLDTLDMDVVTHDNEQVIARIEPELPDPSPETQQESIGAIVSSPQSGPLDDIEDAIPLETSVSLPHRSAPIFFQEPSEAERYDAELFQQIANEPIHLAEQAKQIIPDVSRAMPHWLKTCLYVAVLLAALIPLVSNGVTTPWVQPRQAVVDMVRDLDELPAGSAILLSFDYTPAYAEELSPLARAVIQQLSENSVKILAMSTKPGGIGIADQVLVSQTVNKKPLRYSEDFVLLGYLPGEEKGLRSLGVSLDTAFKKDTITNRPLADLVIMQERTTISDLDMVIVLADDQQSVRSWIEQVGQRHDVPLCALTTARIEPAITPYLHSGQLSSLIAGASGAAEYSIMLGTVSYDGTITDAYAAYFVILLLAVVVSNALYLARASRTKGQRVRG